MYSSRSITIFMAAVACLVTLVASQRPRPPPVCDNTLRTTHFEAYKASIRASIAGSVGLRAAVIRAAFHDCVTATKAKPGSGCNGSLQFELGEPGNARLGTAIRVMQRAIRGTCVSLADAIQLASAIAVADNGGPDVVSDVASPLTPRTDATESDVAGAVAAKELPSRDAGFPELAAFYARKGLSVVDLLASSAGGHSFGRFEQNPDDPQTRLLPFTQDRGTFSQSYVFNLFNFVERGRDLRGHNTLPSDRALISDDAAVARSTLRLYAGCVDDPAETCATSTAGLVHLSDDFGEYLKKQARISDSTVVSDAP